MRLRLVVTSVSVFATVILTGAPVSAQGFCFNPARQFAVGASPQSVFAADLDGDGDQDLAVPNYNGANLSILKNNGDGTFAAAVNYAVGTYPTSVFAADLDGDNDADLAVANGSSNTVSVLKNVGDGTFIAPVSYATGGGPRSIFAADLDADGDQDLIVANSGSGNISVLKNNGDGTFAAAVNYAVGTYPTAVFAADLDNDGDQDLVVANGSSSNVSVLKNNGNGTFAAGVNYAAGGGPQSVVAADLDGDSDADLVVANAWSGNVSVLKNNGDGTFASAMNYPAGDRPYSVVAAHLDSDHATDLAVANIWSDNLSVLKNIGDGTFTAAVNYPTGSYPNSVFVADLDGSNDADLVVANGGSDNVSVLVNCITVKSPVTVVLEEVTRIRPNDSTSFSPTLLSSVIVGDRLRIRGQVKDAVGNGVSGVHVRCYDPITGDRSSGDSAIFRVTTNASGHFNYPDSAIRPEGILCTQANFFSLWFQSSSVAVPLIVPVAARTGMDPMYDSLGQWVSQMGFPPGTRIGLVEDSTDPLFVRIAPYPPNDLDLNSHANDAFFEALVWSYSGPTSELFLTGDSLAWLERGYRTHKARAEAVAETLHTYLANKQSSFQALALVNADGSVSVFRDGRTVPPGFWKGATNFALTYGLEMAGCGVGLAIGVGAIPACGPLVISLANNYLVKPVVVKAVCNNVLRARDSRQCRATGNLIADGAAFFGSVALSPSKGVLRQHLKWLRNPRNLHGGRIKAGLELIKDARQLYKSTNIGIRTGDAVSRYLSGGLPGLILGSQGSDIGSFGFADLSYEDSANSYLDSMVFSAMFTMLAPPRLYLSTEWDNPAAPTFLTVTVRPDRGIFVRGSNEYAPPGLSIASGGLNSPFLFQQIDTANNVYWTSIPVGQLPGFVPGQAYRATVRTFGYDLTANFGTWESPSALSTCGPGGMSIVDDSGQGIVIPPGAIQGEVVITLLADGQSPAQLNQASTSGGVLTDISGSVLRIGPETLLFSIPASVSLRFDKNDLKYMTSNTTMGLGRWSDSLGGWVTIPSMVDTASGMIQGQTNRLGRFAAVFRTVVPVGDMNLDSYLDVFDVVALIDYVFANAPEPEPAQLADVNCDGVADVFDIIALIDVVFSGGATPSCP